MNIFSYHFFVLWAAGVVLYYTIARKHQWLLLLCVSLVFYTYTITKVPVVLLLVSLLTYTGAVWITDTRERKRRPEKMLQRVKWVIAAACIVVLIVNSTTKWFFMLGNSYFTLKAISYLYDVERDEKNCERNFFFYLLYLIYLPTVLQGPFNRFAQFRENFVERVRFDYTGFMHGIQRFLWGAFKKLVLAARLEQIGTFVSGNWESQSGLSIIIGITAYSLWFYMDFSSYMDMMLGMSGTFGVALPENFRQPYFSKSIAEFWRRWHITLGGVFRDYVMIPFVQSGAGRKLRKHFKKYSKNAGKLAPVLVGTFIVWIGTALWHGFTLNYLIWGMYYCIIISSSLTLEGVYGRIKMRLHIADDSKGYAVFCMIRTWILLFAANVILQVNNFSELLIIIRQLTGRSLWVGGYVGLPALGWIKQDAVILVIGLLVLLLVSVAKEKNVNVLGVIDRQVLPIRWIIYYALLFAVLLFGMYGSQYDASQFIYMQF